MILENKVALITGAGKGIGKAIATRFVEEGVAVVLNDVDAGFIENMAEQFKKKGKHALAAKADVSIWTEVEAMFNRAAGHFGSGIDILVNNAGIRNDAPFHKMTEAEWDPVIATLLKGNFNCARAAQKYMVEKGYGKIISISSPAPSFVGSLVQTNYAAANAAIQGFTRALATELGRYNINVNCVAPDFIDTEMTRNAARREGLYMDDFKKLALAQVPLRRLGRPEDVANAVLFLASDESSFISGQVVCVRGGP